MKKIALIVLTLILILSTGTSAFALPQGQSIESGFASFDQPDTNTLDIIASDKTVINFNSFDIGAQETVNFIQPDSNASVLSRVIGNAFSSILGKLFANGILFLINPNGIYIGSSANIQASAFVASTLDISTNNFINQRYIFEHDPDRIYSQILNKGAISANNVSLIASAVDNQGLIFAKAGTINLASGDKITVSFDTNNCLQVEITAETSGKVISLEDGETLDSAISNSGTLEARAVIMSAKTAANIFEYAVNQTGIVRGTGLVEENGTIRIVANRQIQVSGTLEAPQGNIKVSSDEGIYNFSGMPIQANNLTLIAPIIYTPTQAENLTLYRNAENMNLSACNKNGDIITLEGDGILVTYLYSTHLTLKSDYSINTEPGVIIQANSLNLLANKFGTSTQPINVDAALTYISRLNGNIDIMESQGLGSTMMIRGPPEGFGAIIYNQETNLTLEAVNGNINIAQAAYLYSNNLSLFASGDIKSLGVIKTNTLIERGASFLVGGTFQVVYASMINADNAVTFNTGNYTGTYSDAVDIIINDSAIITLIGNTIFWADSDANGTGAFIMNTGSSIAGGGYNLTIYASQASTLISITGVGNLTLRASKTGSNPTYTANSVLSVNNTVTITSCTLFMNSYDLITNSIVNNGTLRGANYYVDATGGNDTNPGTWQGKTWKTIAKVNTTSLQPGDSVLFNRGETWIGEGLVINASGMSDSPITIGAYGTGANPLFRAAETVAELGKTWTFDSGNIYYITGISYWANYALESNETVLWPVNSKSAMTAGTSFYDSATGRFYVWVTAGGTPPTSVYIPSNIPGGVVELKQNQSYINVNNIDVKYARDNAFRISSDYTNISDCNADYAAGAGFYFFHNWPNAVGADYGNAYRDTAKHTNIITSQAFTVEGSYTWLYDCVAEDNYMAGFDFLDYSENTNAHHSGAIRCIARRNAQRQWSYDPNFYIDGANNISLIDCLSEDAGYNNVNYNPGITISSEHDNKQTHAIWIINTIVYGQKGVAISISSLSTALIDDIHLLNNTLIQGDDGYCVLNIGDIDPAGTGIFMYNNIFVGGSGELAPWLDDFIAAKITADYNNYYNTNNKGYIFRIYSGDTPTSYTLTSWRSTYHQDIHSISADPLLNSDYTLQSSSPCINKGITLSEVPDDYAGTSRPQGTAFDIGAYEFINITQYILTVTGITVDNKIYDGSTAATLNFSSAALAGIFGSDIVTLNFASAIGVFDTKNVGTNKTVTISGLTLSGADAGNYTLIQPTTTANITARPLTVTAVSNSKVYDGSLNTAATLADNRIAGDILTASYASAVFNDKNVGTAKPVSVSGISISGTDSANYTFNTTASTTANITARLLTVTATGIDKVYDGTTAATVTLADNRIAGDSLTTSYASATFADENVGTAKPVSVNGISISGTDTGNYTFNTTAQTIANITAADISTITGTFIFTGTGDWLNILLWSIGTVPGINATVIIDGICNLTSNVLGLNTLTINSGTSLNLAGYNIGTIGGITNNGTLYLLGNEVITGSLTNAALSTVTYRGAGSYSGLAAGNNYYNLNFNGTGTWALTNSLNISANLSIATGNTLNANGKAIIIAGNWTNNGTFNNNSGTVTLNGTSLQEVKTGGANSAFSTLTITNKSTSGVKFTDALYTETLNATGGVKKLSFATGRGIVHTITKSFNVAGTNSSNLLKLAPATAGKVWYLNAPSCTIKYINVSYCSEAAGKTITAIYSNNGGHNTNWKIYRRG